MDLGATDNEFSDGLFSLKDFNYRKTFESDFDNTYYINYFSDVTEYLDNHDYIKYYKSLRYLIRKGLKRSDIGIRMKYMWMLKKFNSEKPFDVKDMAYKEIDALNQQISKRSK